MDNQAANNEIGRLTQTRFVFHSWQNMPILGPDGVLFYLDTKSIDVDRDSEYTDIDGNVHLAGLPYLKRLRMIPVTTTQKPIIDNKAGFAVSNVFLGSIGNDGQPSGIGSNMSGSMKTNVKGEWVYPDAKVSDMVYTFGKFGLVGVQSLWASDENSQKRCLDISRVVTSGLSDRTLLEDIPEYFDPDYVSDYFPDKRRARFPKTAEAIIELAADTGVEINGHIVKLTTEEYAKALRLKGEMLASVIAAHNAALDPESTGILPQSREGRQSKQKASWDKCDQWLMGQFPSYPMDTELEKSQAQLMRALGDGGSGQPDVSEEVSDLSLQLQEERERNDRLEERLSRLESAPPASAPVVPSPPSA